ncbi:MAG: SAM-dependent methyltransferase, partial [Planctomycetaceae bacterium]|nr:SAM-dependent methyltransferase [Planctomycetaceae bacterium]
ANVYSWPIEIFDLKTRSKFDLLGARVNDTVERLVGSGGWMQSQCHADLFGDLYAKLIPAKARKRLGEFYTPAWLADLMLHVAGLDDAINSGKNIRVLDPSCGSGTFLLAAARRMLKTGVPTEHIARCVVGFDLNPLSVMMSTVNLAVLLANHSQVIKSNDSRASAEIPPLQIVCHDSIRNTSPLGRANAGGRSFAETTGQFDFVVGNPPWLAWDKLPPDYREQTKTLWQHYGFFNLSGRDARYGGAKKELALLMVATTADHYLKCGGRLAMVLPQTAFQTHKTGNGFRQFGGDDPTRALKVIRVDDFSAIRVFRDATTKTATLVLEKGCPTTYPVPYFCWQTQHQCRACHAEPVAPEQPGSAWRVTEQHRPSQHVPVSQKSDYTAMLGANTGGANGIYWVEIVSSRSNRLVTIRNLAACGKQPLPVIEAEIESELLYPLLRWRDVDRFSAIPSTWSILVQDPTTRTGWPPEIMEAKYPGTLAYLRKFETQLRNRAAYRKYLPDAPFYSMYNISRETFAPIKVVWRRMDTRIRAAVVQPLDASRDSAFARGRPVIPQETCSMIAVSGLDEAYYLAALLNSETAHRRVAASSVQGGKGFGSPGMLEHLPVKRFDAANETHVLLKQLGQSAAAMPVAAFSNADHPLADIDKLAEQVL